MYASWLFLLAAILLEVCGTTCMKLSQGLTRLGPSLGVFIFYTLSLTALTFALKKLQVSIAYAVWSGVGTALVAVIGTVWFREPMTAVKMVCLTMIIAGVVGLYLLNGQSSPA
jgi:small multidrug resistance pump